MQQQELPMNLVMRNGVLYFRARAGKKLKWKKCPYQGPGAFTAKGSVRPCVLQALADWIGWERNQVEIRKRDPEATPEGRVPTWQQLEDTYLEIARAQCAIDGKPKETTAAMNASALRTIRKGIGMATEESVGMATPKRVREWIEKRVINSTDKEHTQYSLSRMLGLAKSCWARWTRERYLEKGIVIPALLDRWPDVSGVAPLYVDPPDDLKRATIAGGVELERDNPEIWLAYTLMLDCGMRPGDAGRAEWAWFRPIEGGMAILQFVPSKTARSARGRLVEQRLSAGYWGRLCAARGRCEGQGASFVVPGGPDGRQEALEQVNASMRAWGWKTEKAGYELRKLFVSAVYNRAGLKWASALSGDNATTIERYYAAAYRKDTPTLDIPQIVAGAAAGG